jgi:hypothetical protein
MIRNGSNNNKVKKYYAPYRNHIENHSFSIASPVEGEDFRTCLDLVMMCFPSTLESGSVYSKMSDVSEWLDQSNKDSKTTVLTASLS